MNRFWVVWNERGGSPTVQHAQKSEAMREARRLAVKCPGEQFHVLESVCTVVKDDVRVISHDGERDDEDEDCEPGQKLEARFGIGRAARRASGEQF